MILYTQSAIPCNYIDKLIIENKKIPINEVLNNIKSRFKKFEYIIDGYEAVTIDKKAKLDFQIYIKTAKNLDLAVNEFCNKFHFVLVAKNTDTYSLMPDYNYGNETPFLPYDEIDRFLTLALQCIDNFYPKENLKMLVTPFLQYLNSNNISKLENFPVESLPNDVKNAVLKMGIRTCYGGIEEIRALKQYIKILKDKRTTIKKIKYNGEELLVCSGYFRNDGIKYLLPLASISKMQPLISEDDIKYIYNDEDKKSDIISNSKNDDTEITYKSLYDLTENHNIFTNKESNSKIAPRLKRIFIDYSNPQNMNKQILDITLKNFYNYRIITENDYEILLKTGVSMQVNLNTIDKEINNSAPYSLKYINNNVFKNINTEQIYKTKFYYIPLHKATTLILKIMKANNKNEIPVIELPEVVNDYIAQAWIMHELPIINSFFKPLSPCVANYNRSIIDMEIKSDNKGNQFYMKSSFSYENVTSLYTKTISWR